MLGGFLNDLGSFLVYLVGGAAATGIYVLIYTAITPHREFTLIKAQNQAAAIALAGSLLGFVIAITSLIKHSVDLIDFAMWAIVAILVQLLAYAIVRIIFPSISERINDGETPAAIWLAGVSIAAGMLNAACMSW